VLPFNLVVTNVPGPQIPLYLLGSQMTEIYPQIPLFYHQGLGVALFSYAGRLFWGFTAEWDLVPDLHDFVMAVQDSFTELYAAAKTKPLRERRRKPPRRRTGRRNAEVFQDVSHLRA
jgi:hypothetical protein